MSKVYNTGIIGYGWAATAHIGALLATGQSKITSILSSRPLDDAELSAKYGMPIRSFTDPAAFFAQQDLEVVDITGYPWDHAAHAVMAAEHGKHFILEKPIALNWEECLQVERAVKKAGVKTCVCFEVRYSGQFQTVKSMVDEGMLGRVHYGEVDYYHGVGPWYGQYRWNIKKSGGGSSLLSAGCHAMDALLLCMPGEVDTVISLNTQSTHPHFSVYEYPTTTTTLLKFSDGRAGKCAQAGVDAGGNGRPQHQEQHHGGQWHACGQAEGTYQLTRIAPVIGKKRGDLAIAAAPTDGDGDAVGDFRKALRHQRAANDIGGDAGADQCAGSQRQGLDEMRQHQRK